MTWQTLHAHSGAWDQIHATAAIRWAAAFFHGPLVIEWQQSAPKGNGKDIGFLTRGAPVKPSGSWDGTSRPWGNRRTSGTMPGGLPGQGKGR